MFGTLWTFPNALLIAALKCGLSKAKFKFIVSFSFYILPIAILSRPLRYNGRENAAGEDKHPW